MDEHMFLCMYVCVCTSLLGWSARSRVLGTMLLSGLIADARCNRKRILLQVMLYMYVCMCMYEGGSEREYSDRIRF